MVTKSKTSLQIDARLNGSADNFFRDSKLFGLTYAIHEYHLEDIPFTKLSEWAMEKSKEQLLSAHGLLREPVSGDTRYMEDFLTEILKKISNLEQANKILEGENQQLRTALQYHRAHPLDACHELMEKIIE